jgi:holo-[acyl-carrier protein] synthase
LYRIGTDIIEIHRIEKAIERHGESFLHRVYTNREVNSYRKSIPSLAARFAAKEAVMKALGQGFLTTGWRDIEVLSEPGGQPTIRLYGRAEHRANQLGLKNLAISLSHCREYALAVVLASSD